jgi:DNA-directed RNA polymerase specialized sigma24 family protein
MEDFSIEEIAGISGVSVGTVKSRLHYAKKSLRQLVVNAPDGGRSPNHPKESQ